VRVPTVRGFIEINATAFGATVEVGLPCNTLATLCAVLPSSAHGVAASNAAQQTAAPSPHNPHRLLLDGVPVLASRLQLSERHACVTSVGCGANGQPRVLSFDATSDRKPSLQL
jgi:hypothetical protein